MPREKTSRINRRTFIKTVGAGAATLVSPGVADTQAPPGATPCPSPPAARRNDRVVYRNQNLRAVAMPIGGIGTGVVALAGDGGLRQWQVVHNVNHLAHVPHSFFAVSAGAGNSEPVARVLQSSALYDQSHFKPPETANDHVIPAESRRLLELLPGVQGLEFAGEYPIAELRYLDAALPAEISVEAYSPFIPLNSKDSGLPVIVFEFKARNPGALPLRVSLLGSLQNFVGWDGHSPIVGVEYFAYGSNRNALERSPGLTAIRMSNPRLPHDFPFYGEVALAALSDDATYLAQWDNLELLWRDFAEDGRLANVEGAEPSAEGRTWNGALAVPVSLKPTEEKKISFLLAWYFPDRYVNWDQSFMSVGDKKSRMWLGTMYSNWFESAMDVVRYVSANFTRLSRETRLWRDKLYDSTLPYTLLDCVSSQSSILRTPTGLWLEDGNFHGFEGCCGASTGHCGNAGCCPLNCTHVWGYEQSLSRLFPDLERTMRHTDWEIQQGPEGYVFTRTALPAYLPRPWQMKTPVEEKVALDGMLSTVLKTYREYRQGAGKDWLVKLWPRVKKCVDYTMATFDADANGLIEGEQYNTYDISIYGVNSFIGAYYLAVLRAAEEMARIVSDEPAAARYHTVFEKGRTNLARELWNGEYFIQKADLAKNPKNEYATGCLSDQLLGQWWSHQLDLGYLLPEDQVRGAVASIFRYNWRENFSGFKQAPRVFASERDQGLLICTWPKGGRPAVPTLYSDEVWTGIEYEVAALLLYEGMADEALKILRGVRARYDGRQRSPWNDIECGDHYARAMSSWALLEAASGFRYNAAQDFLAFDPKIDLENFRSLFITAGGWGTFDQKASAAAQVITLTASYGEIRLRTLELALKGRRRKAAATARGQVVPAETKFSDRSARIALKEAVLLKPGESFRVEM